MRTRKLFTWLLALGVLCAAGLPTFIPQAQAQAPFQGPRGFPGQVGMNWRGPWVAQSAYQARDGVFYGGSSWIAVQNTTGQAPPSVSWQLLAQGSVGPPGAGMIWRGPYNPASAYVAGDGVQLAGSSYIALATTIGVSPPSSPWSLFAQAGTVGATGATGPSGPAPTANAHEVV